MQIAALLPLFHDQRFDLLQGQRRRAGVTILPPVNCREGDAEAGSKLLLSQTGALAESLHQFPEICFGRCHGHVMQALRGHLARTPSAAISVAAARALIPTERRKSLKLLPIVPIVGVERATPGHLNVRGRFRKPGRPRAWDIFMGHETALPNGREISFGEDEIIVSKTDLRGIITYANDVFERISGYSEAELLGQPHNIIRHPDMPACVFKLLWDTLKSGREIFAYVLNLARDGSGYWVFAHVTPSYSLTGEIIGYHSNRRVPYPDALAKVRPLYADLLAIERRAPNRHAGMDAGLAHLTQLLAGNKLDYSQFVFGLSAHTRLEAAA